MEKLPEEFKAKWIAALRSGEYKQCRDQLHFCGGHCCLGVAEIVLGLKSESIYLLKGDNFPSSITYDSEAVVILTGMNDDGKSFSEIADWIEKTL